MKLCSEYPGPRRVEGVRRERWSLIILAYRHIRQVIINNAVVMEKTTIQLPEMNTATVSSWYRNRERQQERAVLQQGINAPGGKSTSSESLPPALEVKGNLYRPFSREEDIHTFILPPNTAGMAQVKKRHIVPPSTLPQQQTSSPSFFLAPSLPVQSLLPVQHSAATIRSLQPAQSTVVFSQILLPAQHTAHSTQVSQSVDVPYTTQWNRRKKTKEEEEGRKKRKYERKSRSTICHQCEQERDPATHQQYFGNWYCQATAQISFAEWKKAKEEQGYGRKKKN